jgi:DNA-binding transcriptional ArsR family regulator
VHRPTHYRLWTDEEQQSDALSLPSILHAFSDPIRLEIVRQIDEAGEKACGKFGLDMPKSSLSHHFRILRESGVIESEGHGTSLMNRLRREALDEKFPGLVASVLAGVHREHRALKRRAN